MPKSRKFIALTIVLFLTISTIGILSWIKVLGESFNYSFDPTIVREGDELPELEGSGPRQIGSMVDTAGNRDDFAINEITMTFRNDTEMDKFLEKYDGEVLRTGEAQPIEGITPPNFSSTSSGFYLIKVNLDKSTLDDLSENMEHNQIFGEYVFSTEEAARLVAILARERVVQIGPNMIMRGAASPEHELSIGGHIDAEQWPWMSENGLSVGVTRAWDYLSYKNIYKTGGSNADSGTYVPTYAAIIDGGFALDNLGRPIGKTSDYAYRGTKPIQADMVDKDGTAGGRNRTQCSGGASCPWHGEGAFGVMGAMPRNEFGSAGSGGPVVNPILIRVDWTWYGAVEGMYSLAESIRAASLFGLGRMRADVASISISGPCWTLCGLTEVGGMEDFHDYMQRTVITAISFGTIVVAAAGNEGMNLDDKPLLTAGGSAWIPCELEQVICVGAIERDAKAKSYSNYGGSVDIWAPTDMLSTPNPDSLLLDNNDVCNGASNIICDELPTFGGTSASTPFVAGILSLMVALDKNSEVPSVIPPRGTPRIKAIQSILQESANQVSGPSADPKLNAGYVDAFKALLRVRSNDLPQLTIVRPNSNQEIGWDGPISLSADYIDPEAIGDDIFRWPGKVSYRSDVDGLLCVSSTPPYSCSSTRTSMTVGAHSITAEAVDAFGGSRSSQLNINIVNRPPTVNIGSPSPTDELYAHQEINLSVYVFDADEEIDDSQIFWSSDISGSLGNGRSVNATLPAGSHVLSASAVDGKGLTVSDSVTVNVLSGEGKPSPEIVYPGDGDPCCFAPGEIITLTGDASDEEDGDLPDSSLEWFSDLDGFIGRGRSVSVSLSGPDVPCQPEFRRHTVRLVATDSDGNEIEDKRSIGIGQVC